MLSAKFSTSNNQQKNVLRNFPSGQHECNLMLWWSRMHATLYLCQGHHCLLNWCICPGRVPILINQENVTSFKGDTVTPHVETRVKLHIVLAMIIMLVHASKQLCNKGSTLLFPRKILYMNNQHGLLKHEIMLILFWRCPFRSGKLLDHNEKLEQTATWEHAQTIISRNLIKMLEIDRCTSFLRTSFVFGVGSDPVSCYRVPSGKSLKANDKPSIQLLDVKPQILPQSQGHVRLHEVSVQLSTVHCIHFYSPVHFHKQQTNI